MRLAASSSGPSTPIPARPRRPRRRARTATTGGSSSRGGGERQELEGRHDAEGAGAHASERPEQVAVVVLVAADDPAVGQDDLCSDQAIGGHPVRPPEDPEPAPEREARDPNRGTGARRDREAVFVQRPVHLTERRPRADPRDPSVDRNGPHRGDVDQQTSGRGLPGEAVSPAPRRVFQAVSSNERDGPGDIPRFRTPDDAQRPDLIESSVERPARSLVGLGVGEFDDPGDRTLERLPVGGRTRHGGSVSRLLQPKRSPGRARRPGSASARPGSSNRRARRR